MKALRLAAGLTVLLAASCARDASTTRPAAEPRKTLSQRLDEQGGYTQDADGNWVPRNNKRSSFESMGSAPQGRSRYATKTYKTGEYKRRSWWGNKEYGRTTYAGDTDGSRFQTRSRLDGQGARETDNRADLPGAFPTAAYATTAAREAGQSGLTKPSDAETDVRRRVYQPPAVIDWREQRSLTLEQSKGILGR